MHRILTALTITITYPALLVGICLAESGGVRNRDGTSGRLSHLGDDIGIYSDQHGNHTIVTTLGVESPIGLQPHGDIESGHRSMFGMPPLWVFRTSNWKLEWTSYSAPSCGSRSVKSS